MPQTVRSTVEWLFLCLKAAAALTMGLACEPPLYLFRNKFDLHVRQQRPPFRERQARVRKTAIKALNDGQNSLALLGRALSLSINLASMINRMACSHRCETEQPTSNGTGAATENTSGPDEKPPSFCTLSPESGKKHCEAWRSDNHDPLT
ncbi:MAG: hypothetical protein P4L40_26910 [Terracidiphilus sp.]|nr:hypothetical protein [Terracidiphilus sp.]